MNIKLSKRILVVEDDVIIRDTLTTALELEGYDVTTASNGKEALEHLSNKPSSLPHVILLDLMMPIMSGWEFLQNYSQDSGLNQIPVIVISAAYGIDIPPEAHAFLSKPVDLDRLYQLISQSTA